MILPGDRVRWGEDILTVGAVGLTGGERYVWLVDAAEVVTMVPAADVEKVNSDPCSSVRVSDRK